MAPVPREGVECASANAAIIRAEGLSRAIRNINAAAFSRTGDPALDDFTDANILKAFCDVTDLTML
jgi:hypothetical protein